MLYKRWKYILWLLVFVVSPASAVPEGSIHTGETLSVISLNMAHGRKDALNQLLVTTRRTRENIDEIATVLQETGADVIALQEADGPSRWSGKFDHVSYLSQKAAYPDIVHSRHANNWMYDYGTALISRVPFRESISHTFSPTPPTTNKGFTLAQIAWRVDTGAQQPTLIDIVSVHLDFSRQSVREQQINELASVLENRRSPVIVMGDFNAEWFADDQVIRDLAEQASLHTYLPNATNLGTYISRGTRLDWVLISEELDFVEYRNVKEVLSDHYAVQAVIRQR